MATMQTETSDFLLINDDPSPGERRPGNPIAGTVLSLAFSPDSRTLVSGGYEGELKLWDVGQLAEHAWRTP